MGAAKENEFFLIKITKRFLLLFLLLLPDCLLLLDVILEYTVSFFLPSTNFFYVYIVLKTFIFLTLPF